MQISGSAFNVGLGGIQSGQRRIDQAASNIAGAGVDRTAQALGNSQARTDSADVASDMVELNSGKYEAQAGARVVETADEVLGTLIDIRA
ncbi:hypothetical protein [Pseudomonas sp. RIT-PI-AD]|uniref:hypothetical protein n=1 Tax=Pseudomonas sp. RIT-PI-AD TaxID=3035294 RepID=UPI0021D8C3F4|nr:hypothetical protein [Pseudomonas sp. RIT-PI-AD]